MGGSSIHCESGISFLSTLSEIYLQLFLCGNSFSIQASDFIWQTLTSQQIHVYLHFIGFQNYEDINFWKKQKSTSFYFLNIWGMKSESAKTQVLYKTDEKKNKFGWNTLIRQNCQVHMRLHIFFWVGFDAKLMISVIHQKLCQRFFSSDFQKSKSEMGAAPDFTLLCLHVETFRVSDNPEVALTQVTHLHVTYFRSQVYLGSDYFRSQVYLGSDIWVQMFVLDLV